MKVGIIDYIWAFLSLLLIGVSFHFGELLYGLLGVYVLMVALFAFHIFSVKRRQSRSVAVFGTITEYKETSDLRKHYYPVLCYDTEDGREIKSAYTISDREKRYPEGSQEMICYDPDDPEFFYFASRAADMVNDYYRFIIYGSIPALFVLLIVIFY